MSSTPISHDHHQHQRGERRPRHRHDAGADADQPEQHDGPAVVLAAPMADRAGNRHGAADQRVGREQRDQRQQGQPRPGQGQHREQDAGRAAQGQHPP
jgi:hypothetical protein